MTPTAVSTLVAEGHTVSVENNAGVGSGFQNETYIDAGAQIVENPKEVYRADMIIKVKSHCLKSMNTSKKDNSYTPIFTMHLPKH